MGCEKGRTMSDKRGREILNDPVLNRGADLTAAEREELTLRGLLPVAQETLQ
jgi:hypothetical protein